MKWPRLVPSKLCKTEVVVTLYREGLDEDGAPLETISITTLCNWQDSAKTVRTDQEHFVQLSGVALFPGDLCPALAVISAGTVLVHGVKRDILRGSKCRNPDGTVNYTRLEVV